MLHMCYTYSKGQSPDDRQHVTDHIGTADNQGHYRHAIKGEGVG